MLDVAAPPRARAARRVALWTSALVALFAFRLLFGLCYEFFFEDETQIFLIGLRAYVLRRWPYFGPDVVWTRSQIPGALQGLLVGMPFVAWPAPEAPFVLLNVLSMAGVALIAWYITARLPSLPRWLVWGWLMTIPWTLNYGTSLINPSYVLPAATVFFVGFFEAHPRLSLRRISSPVAHFMMGAAITWVLQVHMSWPLLLPYVALVFFARRAEGIGALARDAGALALGAAVPGALLVPTFVHYGTGVGTGGTTRNLHLHWVGANIALTTLARFLSFPSLEVVRFIATDTAKRVMFIARHWWIAPLVAVVWAVGIVHPLVMLGQWFTRRHPARADWTIIRWLVAGTIAVIVASYCFVMEPPQAHAFYAVAPLAFVYAAYCWALIDRPRWRTVAAVVLAINIAYHFGLALAEAPERSLYKNRALVAAAVSSRTPEMLGHRREFAMDAIPQADAHQRRDPRDEVAVVASSVTIHAAHAAVWTMRIDNHSATRAYRDFLYRAVYRDKDGRVLATRFGPIRDVVQPGESRSEEVNDGSVTMPFASATFELMEGEPLIPMRR